MGTTRRVLLKFNHSPMCYINDAKGLTLYVDTDGTSFFGEEQPQEKPMPTRTKVAEPAQDLEPEMSFKTYIDTLIAMNPKGTSFYKTTKKSIKEEIRKGKARGETYDPYANQGRCAIC